MATIKRRFWRFLGWTAAVLAGLVVVVAIAGFFIVRSLVEPDASAFGTVEDEAKRAELDRTHFKAASDPYFAEMDKGLLMQPAPGAAFSAEIMEVAKPTGLEPEAVRQAAIRGQNAWIVWTGATTVLGFRGNNRDRVLRPAEDHVLAPEPGLRAMEPLPLSRPDKRALLQTADGRRRQAFRTVDRSA